MNTLAKAPQNSLKSLLSNDNVKIKFQEILRDRAAGFTANLAVMVNNSAALSKCDPITIISAAVVSASLDLPLDPNLGFAAIVPFGDKATFQIMYKGLIQLAMRSGQYKTINVTDIYEGELLSENKLSGECEFDFTKDRTGKAVGYAAYFKLLNGYEKTIYWPLLKIENHGKRFSQTYRKGYGLWKDDFDSMAKKTVLKNLISKWGVLSIEMQDAVKLDQAVVQDLDSNEYEYIDNSAVPIVDKDKQDVKITQIQSDLKEVIDKKAAKKETVEKRMVFKTEDEARKFITKDLGILPENLEGEKLYSTAKELDINIVINNGKLL